MIIEQRMRADAIQTITRAKRTDVDVNEEEEGVTHRDERESWRYLPRSWGIEWHSDPFCTVSRTDLGQYLKER